MAKLKKLTKVKRAKSLRQAKKARLRGMTTDKVISPRHKAHLMDPDTAFIHGRDAGVGLQSTAIWKFVYDDIRQRLLITFTKIRVKKGKVVSIREGNQYLYHYVPERIHEGLILASSKGRYFNRHIKYKYKYQRVR
ncbi:MAG: KTSC domain-containing protein [PVC group bacterium]|nr:KTSC domain-containing protein [PVC group bacterium]